jgi:hypothetical protein
LAFRSPESRQSFQSIRHEWNRGAQAILRADREVDHELDVQPAGGLAESFLRLLVGHRQVERPILIHVGSLRCVGIDMKRHLLRPDQGSFRATSLSRPEGYFSRIHPHHTRLVLGPLFNRFLKVPGARDVGGAGAAT